MGRVKEAEGFERFKKFRVRAVEGFERFKRFKVKEVQALNVTFFSLMTAGMPASRMFSSAASV